MTQIPYFNPSIPQDFRNRKSGLVAFGILMIVMGALFGCMAGVMPLAAVFQAKAGANPASRMAMTGMISATALYSALATGMIWIGIGSILARRWVRPIVLVLGTLWVCIGVVTLIVVSISLTSLPAIIAAQQGTTTGAAPPPGAVMIGGVIAIGVTLIFYLIVPGVLVWYYRALDVRRTLEFYDPIQRWTDACPLPVLGMSIACVLIAAGTLLATPYGMLFLFGTLLTGAQAVIVMIPTALLFAVSAVLIYRRKLLGWNLAVAASVISSTAFIVSAFFYDMDNLAAAMHATTQETEIMRVSPTSHPLFMASGTTIMTVAGLIYAIRIRHYFKEAESAPPIVPVA